MKKRFLRFNLVLNPASLTSSEKRASAEIFWESNDSSPPMLQTSRLNCSFLIFSLFGRAWEGFGLLM
ncbi:hypothetical protein V3C99_006574 [Haemonchus contortus]